MTQFKYRFVPYGTRFHDTPGERPGKADPGALHQNELVVDVGGMCWGRNDTDVPRVLDHHFAWKDRFPSAAAAVVHNAHRIAGHFRDGSSIKFNTVWLVSHTSPDFDAFCAMYLARKVIEGEVPARGWEVLGIDPTAWVPVELDGRPVRVDWYDPRVPHPALAADDAGRLDATARRWAMLLAAYASSVDNCRRVACPPSRAIHSLLYAGKRRGRPYEGERSGATELFDAIRDRMTADNLDPRYDSVLEGSKEFAPELRLLDGQPEAYARDVLRARRSVVFVRKAMARFDDWFGKVEDAAATTPPFRDPNTGVVNPIHLDPPDAAAAAEAMDAIYIRDPECILFKEWARTDADNSSLGQGFLFTAVAFSGRRPGNPTNKSEYYFSIDPERSEGAHLYVVWARLQAAEMAKHAPQAGTARHEFRARGALEPGAFNDPWFDGQNYKCTIVPTPNQGTYIGRSGKWADLTDDPVAAIVRQELEYRAQYLPTPAGGAPADGPPGFTVTDFPPDDTGVGAVDAAAVGVGELRRFDPGSYRLVTARLKPDVDLTKGATARLVAEAMWPHLGSVAPLEDRPDRPVSMAATTEWVAVWTDRGLAVAAKPGSAAIAPADAGGEFSALRNQFRRMVRLGGQLGRLVSYTGAMGKRNQARVVAEQTPTDAAAAVVACWEAETTRLARARCAGGDCLVDGEEPDEEELLHSGQALLADVAELRYAMTTAAGASARGFFEASGIDRVLTGWVQTHQAAVVGKNVENISEVQSKVKWVELFLVTVYAIELIELLGKTLGFEEPFVGWVLFGVAVLLPCFAFFILRPQAHVLGVRVYVAIAVYFALLIGFLCIGMKWYLKRPDHKTTGTSWLVPAPGYPAGVTTRAGNGAARSSSADRRSGGGVFDGT